MSVKQQQMTTKMSKSVENGQNTSEMVSIYCFFYFSQIFNRNWIFLIDFVVTIWTSAINSSAEFDQCNSNLIKNDLIAKAYLCILLSHKNGLLKPTFSDILVLRTAFFVVQKCFF